MVCITGEVIHTNDDKTYTDLRVHVMVELKTVVTFFLFHTE